MAFTRSLNRVMIIGNLTRDPILREAKSGVLVCTFGVATNISWTNEQGEIQERAEFHNIVVFNKLAEICAKKLAKSMLVYLEGELRNRQKETNDGFRYVKTEIKLNDMKLLDDRGKEAIGVEEAKKAGNEILSRTSSDAPEPVEETVEEKTEVGGSSLSDEEDQGSGKDLDGGEEETDKLF